MSEQAKREQTAMELNDDLPEQVSDGVEIGDTVTCTKSAIEYCSGCGRLLRNYQATIVGVRGVLDGNTIYWITRNCCGKKTSMSELEILG